MYIRYRKNVIILVLILVFLASSTFADIVVFEQYHTSFTLEGNSLFVEKKLKLKNVGPSPIIPGEIHFKISQSKGDESIAPRINNFEVINRYDKKLDSKQIKTDGKMDLVFTVWDPLLPKFTYDLTMRYEIDFNPSGIIFYQIDIPEEKTTIPIRSSKTEFFLPKKYSITYAPEGKVEIRDDKKIISWDTISNLNFEYSIIPMPKTGVPMVNIFWIIVIVLLLIIFIIRVLRSKS
jgi:hypothetical protein